MNGNGVDGVKENKNRVCTYGCHKGKKIDDDTDIYFCSVPSVDCERDGKYSLSITKKGRLMG